MMNIKMMYKKWLVKNLEQDKIEVDVITLENNKDYEIIDTIVYNNNKYLILSNEENDYDICVRKIIIKEDREYLARLDSENEFNEVMTVFNTKYIKKVGNNEE